MSKTLMWVLYDTLSKAQSNPVSTEEAQMAIFKMRPRDIERFYLWTQGWQEWQSLQFYLATDQKNFVSAFTNQNDDTIKAHIRDVLEMTPRNNKKLFEENTASFSSIHLEEDTLTDAGGRLGQQQYDGNDISWENLEKPVIDFSKLKKKRSAEKRETRHELKIEIILISVKGKSFRSKSKNISLSGSLLEDNIPFDYYESVFDMVIVNQSARDPKISRISLKGKTVGEGLTQRLQYTGLTNEKRQELQIFLEEYIYLQKNYGKKSAS